MYRAVAISGMMVAAMTGASMAADASGFDGFYAGVMAGYGATTFSGIVDGTDDGFPEQSEIFSGDQVFGLAYGAVVGVNFVEQDKVFGLELSVLGGNLSDTAIDDGGNDYSTHKLDAVALLSGRAGVAVADDTLIFGKAGLGLAASTFTAYNDMDDVDDAEQGSERIIRPVVAIGAGVEHAVSDTLSVRLDGTYLMPIGQYDFADAQLTSDMDAGDYAKIDGTVIVTAGIVSRF